MWAIRCAASALYMKDSRPARGEIELSLTERQAEKFTDLGDCSTVANALRAVFGSFDWQPVWVAK